MSVISTSNPATTQQPQTQQLVAQIERAAMALEQQQVEGRQVGRLRSMQARLRDKRLQVAVLGQFKRGKSSLINALLGAPVLPVAVIPLTAVPVFISWNPQSFARVTFSAGRSPERLESSEPKELQEFLAQFVAEERNPHNRLGVDQVELAYPSPFLSNGIVLIDTPGVGSSHLHNTETALRVLPECDAAIFVVSADPPITASEIDYLGQIKSTAARIVFILNKIDHLDAVEKHTAIEFMRKVLSDRSLIRQADSIIGVSARDALSARLRNDADELQRSGIEEVEAELFLTIMQDKNVLLERAARRKALAIITQAVAAIEIRIKVTTLPMEELASRAATFEDALVAMHEQHRVLRDLLDGDRRRLVADLEQQIGALRAEMHSTLRAAIDRALSTDDAGLWEKEATSAIAKTIAGQFSDARERFCLTFAEATSKALDSHESRLGRLLDSIREAAARSFDILLPASEPHQSFELGQDPYWVTDSIDMTLMPDAGRMLDRLVPLSVRRSRVRSRLEHRVDNLIVRNAENLRWAILRGIAETMEKATDAIEQQLSDAIAATKGVIDEALSQRAAHSHQSEAVISDLQRTVKVLSDICEELREHGNDRS